MNSDQPETELQYPSRSGSRLPVSNTSVNTPPVGFHFTFNWMIGPHGLEQVGA